MARPVCISSPLAPRHSGRALDYSPMRLLLAITLLVAASAAANPFAGIPTYMASERLEVSVSTADAKFVGHFLFRRAVAVASEQNSRVVFKIPIWFPEENPKDKSVAAFWEAFAKNTSHVIPTGRVTWARPEVVADWRRTLKRSIDLKVMVGEREIPVTVFDIFTADTMRVGIPKAWREPGFCCVMFGFGIEPSLLRNEAQVTISYRQPLLRLNGQARSVYVPIFDNLPKGVSTADTNHYSITLMADKDCVLSVQNGEERSIVRAGRSVALEPSHHRAIRVAVEPWSNPQGRANGRQPFSSETNRTSAAAASRRSP
jgi:hypothetical protein